MFWLYKDPVVIMKEIISWLFKDPVVTVAWLNFDYAQSNSKKWPKKIKLPQIKFFLKKQLKNFMYLSAPLIVQNFKIILRADPELRGCAILGSKMAHLSWIKVFLVQTIIITFIYLLALLIVQKNFKKSYSRSRVMRMHHFWDAPFFHLPQFFFFFWKVINIIFIYLLAPFIVQNFFKNVAADLELKGHGPKMAH